MAEIDRIRPDNLNEEPSNALTRRTQANMRKELAEMNEQNLAVMTNALMRLMGMLYIELAKVLINVRDERMRASGTERVNAGEMVEIEVEGEEDEDDESIYVQTRLDTTQQMTWPSLLQRLVHLADSGEEHRGLLEALRRRILQSLYLTTQRGAQLHATLVAIAGYTSAGVAGMCDTEENDEATTMEWWELLKKHMALGEQDSAPELGHRERPGHPSNRLPEPGHRPVEVEEWERERRELLQEQREEQRREEAFLEARAEVERTQAEADAALYESHEAARYKDWENWVVLNEPVRPKRRRLLVDVRPGSAPGQAQTGTGHRTSVELPSGSGDFHMILQVQRTAELNLEHAMPGDTERGTNPGGPDINSEIYERAYQEWKGGKLSDDLVRRLFGEDWLFLFGVNRDGLPGDTVPPQGPAGTATGGAGTEPSTTLLDEAGETSALEGGRVWKQDLASRDGVVDLGGDSMTSTGNEEGQGTNIDGQGDASQELAVVLDAAGTMDRSWGLADRDDSAE